MALIGYVSVGKTTVLNALFGAKYGEVAMKRTTAVVNFFRICPKKDGEIKQDQDSEDDSTGAGVSPRLSASVIREETASDN